VQALSIDEGVVMRARVKPHALSEHAAFVALTAMERGRLDHIARSIPPEHAAVPERPATLAALRGRPLLLRWVLVVTGAEALGFAAPAVVGAATASSASSVVVPALLAAGLIEGTFLGAGQAMVLRRAVPDVSPRRWVLATAVGAMLAYALGLLPSSLGGDWSPAATVAGSIVLGVLIVTTIGGTQWLVLRRHLDGAYRWILITAAAWMLGLAAFVGFSTPLWHDGQSPIAVVGVGVVGGLLMALVTAGITGFGLTRMLSKDDRIH
jgi:hypothetical protein